MLWNDIDVRTATGPTDTVGDTGVLAETDAIKPINDGDIANEGTFQRPSENLRERTDRLRQTVREHIVLQETQQQFLKGGGTISFTNAHDAAAPGSGTVVITADLEVIPHNSPGVASTHASLTTSTITFTSNWAQWEQPTPVDPDTDICAETNLISIEIVGGQAGGAAVVSVSGGTHILIEVELGVTLNSTVVTSVNGHTEAGALVTAAAGTPGGFVTAFGPTQWTALGGWEYRYLRGGAPALKYIITAANLATFFATVDNQFHKGDVLAIWYDALVHLSDAGGRLQAIPENSGKTTVPAAALFNSRVNPEKLPNCIPICRCDDSTGVYVTFIDGSRILAGYDSQLGWDSYHVTKLLNYDRDIIPGTDLTYKVGSISPSNKRWLAMYAGQFITTGAGAGLPGVDATGGATSGVGVQGTGGTTNGSGVKGIGGATNGVGVEGVGTGSGSGVKGTSTNDIGVEGVSTGGHGVSGTSTNETGVFGHSTNDNGVEGQSHYGSGYGVAGRGSANNAGGVQGIGNGSGVGVRGTSDTGVGILGVGGAANVGVRGEGTGNYGGEFIGGASSAGVYGESGGGTAPGVYGKSTSGTGAGVKGEVTAGDTNGVEGLGHGTGAGVKGTSSITGGYGVLGIASGVGVVSMGVTGQGNGGVTSAGVAGTDSNLGTGVIGQSTNGYGVYGQGTAAVGVYGTGGTDGVYGHSVNGYGVRGVSTNSVGVLGNSFSLNADKTIYIPVGFGMGFPTAEIAGTCSWQYEIADLIEDDHAAESYVYARNSGGHHLAFEVPLTQGARIVKVYVDWRNGSAGSPMSMHVWRVNRSIDYVGSPPSSAKLGSVTASADTNRDIDHVDCPAGIASANFEYQSPFGCTTVYIVVHGTAADDALYNIVIECKVRSVCAFSNGVAVP